MLADVMGSPAAWRAVASLLLAAVAIMGSPGPSTISATAVGAAFGPRRALVYVMGLIAGTGAVLLAVAVGIVAAVLAVPHGPAVISIVGAGYILYLAWCIATAPPLEAARGDVVAPSFGGGFVLAIANPKAYLAIAAVFAGTTVAPGAPGVDAGIKLVLLGGMIVVIHLVWLAVGAVLAGVLRDRVISRIVNMVLAAALCAAALVTLWGTLGPA